MRAQVAKPTSVAEKQRQQALAKIHIAKSQLGLDDETYRAMLFQVIGQNPAYATGFTGDAASVSSKQLTPLGLDAVLTHLKGAGFVVKKQFKGRPHNADSKAANADRIKKIEAQLADAKLPWAYAVAMAERMYKKSALEFCSGDELKGIIAALTRKAEKDGRKSL